jgi:hypothetical protein
MPTLKAKDEAKQKIAKLVTDYQALTPAQVKTYHDLPPITIPLLK